MARILIVDDDPRTTGFIASYLRTAGHECITVDSGPKALEIARDHGIDLLVLDVMLPGGASGFEVCRRIRADADLYTLPILMLSAMAGHEEIMHGLAQGADDYVTKPFDVQNLVQRIEALLRGNVDIGALDEATSLPGARATKREVQRRVSRHDVFVLASAEMLRLREFSYQCGGQGRNKAIRHLARVLQLCGQNLPSDSLLAGHMGGGYFVCLLHPDEAQVYCERVLQTWRTHLPALYNSVGLMKAYEDAQAGTAVGGAIPIVDLLICLTTRHANENPTAQELFEVLTQIRNSALGTAVPGLHVDRRG